MKVEIVGKVLERKARKTATGTRYDLIIEEADGNYTNEFQVSSKNAEVFGAKDGIAAVGKVVRVTCFANGKASDFTGKDGTPGKAYRVWFNCVKVEAVGVVEEKVDDSAEDPDELPF